MTAQDPLVLVMGASVPAAAALLERTAGRGIRILAVSDQAPRKLWPHVTWFEQNLERGPADVRAGTLVSFGPLRHALAQVEQVSGIGRVVAVSTALTRYLALVRNHVDRANLRRRVNIEHRMQAACEERGIVLTLLKPCLLYCGGDSATFSSAVPFLGERGFILLGRGGLRQPVHVDDLARVVVRCLEAGQPSAGSWTLGGGETLNVAAMIERVATGHSIEVRRVPAPAMLARRTLRSMNLPDPVATDLVGLYGHDLLPDDSEAREQLGWQPRGFRP